METHWLYSHNLPEALGKEVELWFLRPSFKNKNDNTKLTDSSEVSLSWYVCKILGKSLVLSGY